MQCTVYYMHAQATYDSLSLIYKCLGWWPGLSVRRAETLHYLHETENRLPDSDPTKVQLVPRRARGDDD